MKTTMETLRNFRKSHAVVFVLVYLPFAVLLFLSLYHRNESTTTQVVTMPIAAAFTGPLTGGIIRNQACCWRASFSMAPVFGIFLFGGIGAQFATKMKPGVRLAAWGMGWFLWFFGIIVSLLHAFS